MSASIDSFGRLVACCSLTFLAVFTAFSSVLLFANEQATESAPVSVAWRLVENLDDSRFRAELTLRNVSQTPVAPPWSMYFNTSAKISLEGGNTQFKLSHVNGDLYALSPAADSSPLKPGDERVLELSGSPWAINVSDAPDGFYLVRKDERGRDLTPEVVPRTIGPFPAAEKIRRGGGDQVPVVTSESRYLENAQLTQIPLDQLSPVVPTPASFQRGKPSVSIDSETVVAYEPQLVAEAKFLVERFENAFGLQLKLVAGSTDATNSIRLKVGEVKFNGVTKQAGGEAYRLNVQPESGIEIVGTDRAGVLYGIQSLRMLVPLNAYQQRGEEISILAIEIGDAPRFGYRGLHLDVARNFQSVATVKKLLELMSFYKLNRLHLHLTDDEGWRIEIAQLPELTAVGGRRGHTLTERDRLIPSYGSGPAIDDAGDGGSGFYSREEFIDILRFANERHIVVVPEIDVPGHSRAAIRAMAERTRQGAGGGHSLLLTDPNDTSKYESVQSWNDNVIDVGLEAAYDFLDIVIGEIATMYRQADAPFEIFHLGGDEVPRGAWEGSPACRKIPTGDAKLTRGQQLEVHFLKRACGIVKKHGATPAAWDDCLLFAIDDEDWPVRPIAYVWNSVLGWGREDAGYRLANSGFEVVLCNASHLYFDLAVEKDPLENGYYWAGFVGNRAPFDFNPFDLLQDARTNSMGQPLAEDLLTKSVRLTPEGRLRILGIQGQLWAENLRSAELLEYMAFPRVIVLAERAWSPELEFVRVVEDAQRRAERDAAWNQFANLLGQRELPRLKHVAGEVRYRVPPPGVVVKENLVHANTAFPGLSIRYTRDGTIPDSASTLYEGPISGSPQLRIRALDANGHGSRVIEVGQLTR